MLRPRILSLRLTSQLRTLEASIKAIPGDEKRLTTTVDAWLQRSEEVMKDNWVRESELLDVLA